MYAYAMEARIVDHNYAKDFSLDKSVFEQQETEHKPKKAFTDEEINKLWQCMEFVPFADMIIFGCYSGWRPGELIILKVEDVNLEKDYIVGVAFGS